MVFPTHPKTDKNSNKNLKYSILCLFSRWLFKSPFFWWMIPSKIANVLLFGFDLQAEWDGFYRKMKELSKVSREVPAERPRCVGGVGVFCVFVFFFWRPFFGGWVGGGGPFFFGLPGSYRMAQKWLILMTDGWIYTNTKNGMI